MASLKHYSLASCLLVVILAFALQQVSATTTHYTLNVPAGGSQQVQVELNQGGVVQFDVTSVTTTLGRDQIDFSIIFNGQVVYSRGGVYQLQDTYVASASGSYFLTFTNNNLVLAKTVELDLTTAPSGTCVIATAAYGSSLAGPAQFLRNFRDFDVANTYAGREFLKGFNSWYYSWAPAVANAEIANLYLGESVRVVILPLLGALFVGSEIFNIFAPSNADAAIALSGVVASVIIGIVYLSPFSLIYSHWRKKRVTGKSLIYALMLGLPLTLLGTVPHGTFGAVQILTGLLVIETMLCASCILPWFVQALRCKSYAKTVGAMKD